MSNRAGIIAGIIFLGALAWLLYKASAKPVEKPQEPKPPEEPEEPPEEPKDRAEISNLEIVVS